MVYSSDNHNHSGILVLCYLIRHFRWGFIKVIQFMKSTSPRFKPTPFYLNQAIRYAKHLESKGVHLTSTWREFKNFWNYDEQLLTLTYINLNLNPAKRRPRVKTNDKVKNVNWSKVLALPIKEERFASKLSLAMAKSSSKRSILSSRILRSPSSKNTVRGVVTTGKKRSNKPIFKLNLLS